MVRSRTARGWLALPAVMLSGCWATDACILRGRTPEQDICYEVHECVFGCAEDEYSSVEPGCSGDLVPFSTCGGEGFPVACNDYAVRSASACP